MADIFTAIADSTRRDILTHLLERGGAGEITAADLSELTGVTVPTVSKHLGVLREQGFVHAREEGRLKYFSLELGPFDSLQTWLSPFVGTGYGDDTAASVVDEDETAVFAAWAGTDVASTIGRALADRRYQARTAFQGAQDRVNKALPRRWRD
jgi:ArsR family transcriptional regulator